MSLIRRLIEGADGGVAIAPTTSSASIVCPRAVHAEDLRGIGAPLGRALDLAPIDMVRLAYRSRAHRRELTGCRKDAGHDLNENSAIVIVTDLPHQDTNLAFCFLRIARISYQRVIGLAPQRADEPTAADVRLAFLK